MPLSDFSDLPEKERKLILQSGNSGIAADIAICEATVRNSLAINNLKKTIVELDGKSEVLNKRILWLTVVTVLLGVVQVIPILIGLYNWMFACSK
jgi:hypothetical protein